METIIYLIRHAEAIKNDVLIEDTNLAQMQNEESKLSEVGKEQAFNLSKKEELLGIDILFSSTYTRALETAKYIAERNNLTILKDANLNERKLGNLVTLKELGKNRRYRYTEEQLLDENLKNVDGESRAEVYRRMKSFLNKILDENEGKKIAIVSHGAAIKFLLTDWCKLNKDCKLIYNEKTIEITSPCIIQLKFEKKSLKQLRVIDFNLNK